MYEQISQKSFKGIKTPNRTENSGAMEEKPKILEDESNFIFSKKTPSSSAAFRSVNFFYGFVGKVTKGVI